MASPGTNLRSEDYCSRMLEPRLGEEGKEVRSVQSTTSKSMSSIPCQHETLLRHRYYSSPSNREEGKPTITPRYQHVIWGIQQQLELSVMRSSGDDNVNIKSRRASS